MLPFSYAVRNLLRTPARLIQLVIGSGLVVLLVCVAGAFERGMNTALQASSEAANVLLVGAGSEESVERSEVPRSVVGIAAGSIYGVAEVLGRPAVSGEVVYNGLIGVSSSASSNGRSTEPTAWVEHQALFRGVTIEALAVHTQVQITAGSFPGPGEIMVGTRASHLLDISDHLLAVGTQLSFEGRTYRISGRFAAPGTVLESELWMGLDDVLTATQRDTLSCVVVRMDEGAYADVALFANQRLDLELVAISEADYYGKLSAFFAPLKIMAWITAALIAVGALFGGLNTWYAAFAARINELATLQAIGFGRVSITISLIQESLLATLTGTMVALTAGVWFLDGLSIAFSSGVFALTFDSATLRSGLITGVILGFLGCLPPAWRCLSPPLPIALRAA